jgi:hypothetical protein
MSLMALSARMEGLISGSDCIAIDENVFVSG